MPDQNDATDGMAQYLSVQWLIDKDYLLVYPKPKPQRVALSKILWQNVQDELKPENDVEAGRILLSVVKGISISTLRRYRENDFQNPISTKEAEKGFDISVVDRKDKIITIFACTIGKLIEHSPEDGPEVKLLIDPERILAQRSADLVAQVGDDIHPDDVEAVSRAILERYAGGLYTIYECCRIQGVRYLDFLRWVGSDTTVQTMYRQAHDAAVWLNDSRQLTMVDNQLVAALQKGYHEVTTIVSTLVRTPNNPGGIMVPEGQRVVRKDISATDLVRIKVALTRRNSDPPTNDDEFSDMSISEIQSWIEENEGLRVKKLKERDDAEDEDLS